MLSYQLKPPVPTDGLPIVTKPYKKLCHGGLMSRHFVSLSIISLVILGFALTFSVGCEGGPPYGTPIYIQEPADPNFQGVKINVLNAKPSGVNLALGGSQKFTAVATYNNGTITDITNKVQWYTETPGAGKFLPGSNQFTAQQPGVAIVRCKIAQGGGFAISNAVFVNIFNPNADNPPVVPLNPSLLGTTDGVLVSWDINKTDGDLRGYNVYRTQVSTAHYAVEFDMTGLAHYASEFRINETPILYPPYLDKTTVGGWYYYRVTAEDLLGLQSAPSEEVSIFETTTK
jgi:hypothetical protein